MDIIGIYLFDQNMGMAFVKARCTHIPLVMIFLGEMQLSVVKSRSALSPLASCFKALADIHMFYFGFLVTSPLGFNTSVGSILFAFAEVNIMYNKIKL